MIKKFFLAAGLAFTVNAGAQSTHTVVKGDTLYNIARRYGLTIAELQNLNPTTREGQVSLGEVLQVNGKAAPAASGNNQATLGRIVLKPKQTIYGLTKQYHISETELRALNPELDSHMRIGDQVTLPLAAIQKYGDAPAVQPAETNTDRVVAEVSSPVSTEPAVVALSENEYEVKPKDNYFKITRQFKITQKKLYDLNPGLEARGLQAGDVIIVKEGANMDSSASSSSSSSSAAAPVTETAVAGDDYVTYTVQAGDTVFGILNKFGITLDDLLSLNPNITQGLKAGMIIKIKKMDAAYVKKSGNALNVVLMLPFGFDTGDAKYRSLSLDFLAGAKLAIERNARAGQQLDIKVIDAGNEKSFKNSLTQINKDNTDLIIGPFFKSSVLEVLDFVKTNKIPVVAPFANSDDLMGYNNLIIIETQDEVYADRIVKEVKDVYAEQKIYILTDSDETQAKYLKAGLEKQLRNATVQIVRSAADIRPEQNMMTGQAAPVIAVLASKNDNLGEAFGNRLITLAQEAPGTRAFSMYYAPIFEKKVEELNPSGLVYLMDRTINTEGNFEKEILAAYRAKYCKAPSKYAVIGFDVTNDMLTRENKKGEIFKQINKVQTQLATKFEFEKTRSGAYVNKGYRVVRLLPN
ncbi:LysM peptidoglycan-binding domain-containing protein [Chryseobacterium salipaludis]|uniref:amino acid ABC transporter substrate-binding protein n=1 Tax=Chryseobacterium TaxID=59732 RepID=UPI001FF651E7|nr:MULTISPECIES: LysM peptidoglycan-binding domain-containing protein [Chryseobacterium]MCJ8497178.1 LysM peptidoglycan-binding domain-containing protein [Chryseobacterium salipaludis]MCX3295585.1 LysM peptidoglycan-binding domain-containing protein [Planobacterium sp. JC490]